MTIVNTLRFILTHPLGRQRRLETVSRFLRWQFSSRTALGPIIVPFVGKSVLLVERGMTGATGNVYVGLHECHDMGFFLHFLRPDDLFVDVGANIGSYTILAAAAVGSRCVSLEPVPTTFGDLTRNLRLNGVEHIVDAHNAGAASTRTRLRFSTDCDSANHVVEHDYSGSHQTIDVLPLDDLLRDRVPIAMKIDVEGFEADVLNGARNTLSKPNLQAILVEVTDLQSRYNRVGQPNAIAMLEASGFSRYHYDACARELRPLETSDSLPHGNILFLRDIDFVRERLRTAPTFHVGPWQI